MPIIANRDISRLTIAGVLLETKSISLNEGGTERTAETGRDVYGHSEKVVESKLSVTITNKSNVDTLAINSWVDVPVVLRDTTGTVTRLTMTTTTTVDGSGMEYKFEMTGFPVRPGDKT